MGLPVTIQQFSGDLDIAKSYLTQAMHETDPDRQQRLAQLAQAAALIANAEANWLTFTVQSK